MEEKKEKGIRTLVLKVGGEAEVKFLSESIKDLGDVIVEGSYMLCVDRKLFFIMHEDNDRADTFKTTSQSVNKCLRATFPECSYVGEILVVQTRTKTSDTLVDLNPSWSLAKLAEKYEVVRSDDHHISFRVKM